MIVFASATLRAEPLLTGVVEDVNAQTIEMPSLPGAWQRRIEWMAAEGSEVSIGDLVVRLDPGDLISREEQMLTDLEKRRLTAARSIDELKLEVLDAENLLGEVESAVRIAQLDAAIPIGTIPKLDFDRYQLALATASKDLVRAQAHLIIKQQQLQDVIEESRLDVEQAQSNHDRIKRALDATEIRAEKAGFMIYGENPYNGKKIFPGETHYSGFEIAQIASREDLQIRFWVHEADIRQLAEGDAIEVIADAQGSEPFMTRVNWLSNQAINKDDWSNSGYFQVLAEPATGMPQTVMPGMSVMGSRSAAEQDQ
jgi:multidrug resistance efflux pump